MFLIKQRRMDLLTDSNQVPKSKMSVQWYLGNGSIIIMDNDRIIDKIFLFGCQTPKTNNEQSTFR